MSETSGASSDFVHVDLTDDRDQIERLEDKILGELDRLGYPKSSRFAIKLAFEEALTNAFQHGHEGLDASTPVRVSYAVSGEGVRIAVEDRGPGFTPQEVPDPTLDENLSNPTGRGIMLMRAYMTRVEHNERGNRVELFYEKPEA